MLTLYPGSWLLVLSCCYSSWAAEYDTRLLNELTPKGVTLSFLFAFLPVLQKLLCRSMHNEGYCVPQSLQQNAGSCSAEGLWNQCGSNDLCFVRGPEEESLEKWYVH